MLLGLNFKLHLLSLFMKNGKCNNSDQFLCPLAPAWAVFCRYTVALDFRVIMDTMILVKRYKNFIFGTVLEWTNTVIYMYYDALLTINLTIFFHDIARPKSFVFYSMSNMITAFTSLSNYQEMNGFVMDQKPGTLHIVVCLICLLRIVCSYCLLFYLKL